MTRRDPTQITDSVTCPDPLISFEVTSTPFQWSTKLIKILLACLLTYIK